MTGISLEGINFGSNNIYHEEYPLHTNSINSFLSETSNVILVHFANNFLDASPGAFLC